MRGQGKKKPVWTEEEISQLEWLYERYCGKPGGLKRLARKLGRPVDGVRVKAQKMGFHRRPDGKSAVNLTHLAEMFCRSRATIRDWVERGNFGSLVRYHESRDYYYIPLDDLWEWMKQPKTWHLWEPQTLPDLAMREHFTELRRGWIDAREAARIIGCTPGRVNVLRAEGTLPGIAGKHWAWYRIEDTERYARQRGGSHARGRRMCGTGRPAGGVRKTNASAAGSAKVVADGLHPTGDR